MAKRKVPFVCNEYYHLYNRGNSKQHIFLDEADYRHFIKCLFICNSIKNFKFRDDIIEQHIDAFDFNRGETLVSIGAWVLMPNHFHLYVTFSHISHMSDMWEKDGKEYKNNISEFMRKLLTAYAKYFNTKYKRTGSLYEGSFRSVHVENDNQAKYLFSYIHLNPIKLIDSKWKENGINDIENALNFLDTYRWGSYLDHSGISRKENKILQLDSFPDYFSCIKEFDSEIFSWLQYK
ncbi:MAG: transposase [Candidatus Magasanikiibacteriota bacterium]